MRARLKRRVKDAVFGLFSRLPESADFSMGLTCLLVPAFPDDPSPFDDDAAYHRVRRRCPSSLKGKLQCHFHVFFVRYHILIITFSSAAPNSSAVMHSA